MKRVFAGLMLTAAIGFIASRAGADGIDVPRKVRHVWHGYSLRLPPERHVVEVVDDFGRLIIAGRPFTPAVPASASASSRATSTAPAGRPSSTIIVGMRPAKSAADTS
jgi:hypothetical protein